MTKLQSPILTANKRTQDFRVNLLMAILFGPFIAALLVVWAFMIVSSEPVTGSIALVVLCISTFCSYRHTRKELKLRERELRVRLDTPREGLAIVDGRVELPPHANPITCEITGRDCIAYSFTMQEVKSSGEDVEQWEVFNESRSVPVQGRHLEAFLALVLPG